MASNKPVVLLFFAISTALLGFGQRRASQQNSGDSISIKFDSLKAAVVTATLRPRMRGDTLEYNAEHVQLPRNAAVEELLSRLPGLHVGPDGTITYNGEKIQHLLVDGEDIFGNDPTMITRNFDAGKIARVQILDRKSDNSIFTGVDDGTRVKTLNLVMRTEAKNGYFGRLAASGAVNRYYSSAGALAGFRGSEQLTALGLSGNTGNIGFNSDEGGLPAAINFLYSMPDPLGASAGLGIPRFNSTALHYANRWNGSEDHITGNYQYGSLASRPITSISTLQTLADSIYSQRQTSQSINNQEQHAFRGQYDWTLSSKTAVQFRFRGTFYHSQNQYSSATASAFNGIATNNSIRSIEDLTSRNSVGIEGGWRTQIGRQLGRTFSMTTVFSNSDYATNGYLKSVNRYFQSNGIPEGLDTIDQRKQLAGRNINFRSSAYYNQSIFSGAVLGLTYSYSLVDDAPHQHTYNRSEGKYNQLVDSLSNDVAGHTITHLGRVNLQGKSRRLSYTAGITFTDYNYSQRFLAADSISHLHYWSWTPNLLLVYAPKPTQDVRLSYSAFTQQPSADQLAPIKNNNDPLHLTLGNPNLKPVTTQQLYVGFRWLKAWIIGASLNLEVGSGSIGIKTITDSLGRQISQPVNLGGQTIGGINFNVDHKIGGVDWSININQLFGRAENYVNSTINRTNNYTSSGGVSASRYVANKYSFQFNTKFTYFYTWNSVNTSAPLHYWTQSHSAVGTVYFLPHYELGTSAVYNWQQSTSGLGGNTSVLLWNAYISRNLLQDMLVVKALMNNILDQNSGITRTMSANITTEAATNILGRYWMLSVIYHFDKKFKKK